MSLRMQIEQHMRHAAEAAMRELHRACGLPSRPVGDSRDLVRLLEAVRTELWALWEAQAGCDMVAQITMGHGLAEDDPRVRALRVHAEHIRAFAASWEPLVSLMHEQLEHDGRRHLQMPPLLAALSGGSDGITLDLLFCGRHRSQLRPEGSPPPSDIRQPDSWSQMSLREREATALAWALAIDEKAASLQDMEAALQCSRAEALWVRIFGVLIQRDLEKTALMHRFDLARLGIYPVSGGDPFTPEVDDDQS